MICLCLEGQGKVRVRVKVVVESFVFSSQGKVRTEFRARSKIMTTIRTEIRLRVKGKSSRRINLEIENPGTIKFQSFHTSSH